MRGGQHPAVGEVVAGKDFRATCGGCDADSHRMLELSRKPFKPRRDSETFRRGPDSIIGASGTMSPLNIVICRRIENCPATVNPANNPVGARRPHRSTTGREWVVTILRVEFQTQIRAVGDSRWSNGTDAARQRPTHLRESRVWISYRAKHLATLGIAGRRMPISRGWHEKPCNCPLRSTVTDRDGQGRRGCAPIRRPTVGVALCHA